MFFLNLVVSVVFLLITGCNGAITPQRYVHKAVAIMDKNALFANGQLWESAKKQALSSTPETMDEAYKIVREALKPAGESILSSWSAQRYNITILYNGGCR
ncbi:MAG: hypothetical protein MJY69_08945 [Bacteroidales bacterium]|nr:hypothetical protein [Bacteroidales bacterium]